MSVAKMSFINIVGRLKNLDDVILKCYRSQNFHPESAAVATENTKGFHPLLEENPYAPLLGKIVDMGVHYKLPLTYADYEGLEETTEQLSEYIRETEQSLSELRVKKRKLKEDIAQYEQALIQINHLLGLNVSFDDIFSMKYIKVRFGRLPADSYQKLSYYGDRDFLFFSFDNDNNYYWGVYFAPSRSAAEIDNLFSSLYFERIWVPDFAHGPTDQAKTTIAATLEDLKRQLDEIYAQMKAITDLNRDKFSMAYSKIKFLSDCFELRKCVSVLDGKFYMVGFVPENEAQAFIQSVEQVKHVEAFAQPPDVDARFEPPVKLKNGWFSRPFEQFVAMYGLPSPTDIDPTPFVAITYTLLFGIMFGDLGQGLVIMILGLILTKWKKMNFGKILTRIGLSSAVFGCVYGSVFGNEHLLDPLYQNLFGLEEKPIEVLDAGAINMILIASIVIGVVVILISMLFNIFCGFRCKDYRRAVFGQNGIAGLVLYGTTLVGAGLFFLGTNIFHPVVIALCIVLPLILIFLQGPLGDFAKRRTKKPEKVKWGEYISENFFELFEIVLSFLTNTMSFLRIGGFVLSHAGMMLVVMTLSSTFASASPVVMVVGNLFVMGMEGLIVGIQVLRLEFYEIFSRFYEGEGKEFAPIAIQYGNEETE